MGFVVAYISKYICVVSLAFCRFGSVVSVSHVSSGEIVTDESTKGFVSNSRTTCGLSVYRPRHCGRPSACCILFAVSSSILTLFSRHWPTRSPSDYNAWPHISRALDVNTWFKYKISIPESNTSFQYGRRSPTALFLKYLAGRRISGIRHQVSGIRYQVLV